MNMQIILKYTINCRETGKVISYRKYTVCVCVCVHLCACLTVSDYVCELTLFHGKIPPELLLALQTQSRQCLKALM